MLIKKGLSKYDSPYVFIQTNQVPICGRNLYP